jgi:oligopeptide/dipeptide ABC transporter ATP-binding protein
VTGPDNLLEVNDLVVRFPVGHGRVVHAVEGVSFTIAPGETLGLVGESGSGKSTTGFALLHRYQPTSGQILFEGEDITFAKGKELRALRRDMQIVFQDPYTSLNPRMKVGDIVAEPLIVHGLAKDGPELKKQVGELLEMCGLRPAAASRYPTAFSGGERQRVAIARALALNPKLIVADEAVSALDVSIQAQIINLLVELQREKKLSYLFISHNLAVVRNIAHRVMIMYAGKIMEVGAVEDIFERPRNPYTLALLSAAPVADPKIERSRERIVLTGEVPSVISPPKGCRFNTRCPLAEGRCFEEHPPLEEKAPGQWSACWKIAPGQTAEDAAHVRAVAHAAA